MSVDPKRSAAAKKAAATRKRNRENPMRASMPKGIPEKKYPYIQNSRVARWALSGVSVIAMMRNARKTRWGARTFMCSYSFHPSFLGG